MAIIFATTRPQSLSNDQLNFHCCWSKIAERVEKGSEFGPRLQYQDGDPRSKNNASVRRGLNTDIPVKSYSDSAGAGVPTSAVSTRRLAAAHATRRETARTTAALMRR